MEMPCPLCQQTDTQTLDLGDYFFDAIVYKPWSSIVCSLFYCNVCSLVYRHYDEKIKRVHDLFLEDSFEETYTGSHVVIPSDTGEPLSPYRLKANLFGGFLEQTYPAVLDIGCFDGQFLFEFRQMMAGRGSYSGFDLKIRNAFSRYPEFKFYDKELETIEGKFDLINLSHSMAYIPDTTRLMSNLNRLLETDGFISFTGSNLVKKPASLLYAENLNHYTPTILKNIFGAYGFTFEELKSDSFPRDILGIARRTEEGTTIFEFAEDRAVFESIEYLRDTVKALKDLPLGNTEYSVLGTTSEAAFVNNILGSNVRSFTDENPSKCDSTFLGKPVNGPTVLDEGVTLIIPYGNTGKTIADRLRKSHPFSSIVI
jgi:SAM-dependent methyltransferase